MKTPLFSLPGLALLLLATAHAGTEQPLESYVLATGKLPPAGIVMTRTLTTQLVDVPLTFTAGEKKVEGAMNENKVTIATETILAPDKFTKEITSSKASGGMRMGKVTTPSHPKPDPLENVVVLVSKVDGHWYSTLENGQPLPKEQLEALSWDRFDKGFASDQALFGGTPRKPGDQWQVQARTVPAFGGLEGTKGIFHCEFVGTREVDSMPSAVIHITFDITGFSAKDVLKRTVHLTGDMLTTRSLEYEINLESRITAVIDVTRPTPAGMEMRMNGPLLLNETTTIRKPLTPPHG